ncbi:WG repeat-containing protein [Paenibacillus sp. MBLB4367]|uniref:WG repeat-containing protein n=1 Tax=Paenibacillus sp. MBLB4367 TaxID=3384767 RepID=UPI0039081340
MRNRRFQTCLLTALLTVTLCSPVSTLYADSKSEEPIQVLMDGRPLPLDPRAQLLEDSVYVPFRPFFEKLGLQIFWIDETRTVLGKGKSVEMELSIGSRKAKVNGQSVELTAPPAIRDGVTYVPLRFVTENVKGEVDWNGTTRTVEIASSAEGKLRRAVIRRSDALIRQLLDSGAYPHYEDGFGMTLLERAIEARDPNAVRALLKAGADPDSRNGKGDSALHQAIRLDDKELVQLLLDAKADPWLPNAEGKTPIAMVADGSVSTSIKGLLDATSSRLEKDNRPLWPAGHKGIYGFIDRSGNWVIDPQYRSIHGFSEGLAVVTVDTPDGNLEGYIDKTGKSVIDPTFTVASSFHEGLGVVTNVQGSEIVTSYIDKSGKPAIPKRYTYGFSFNEGLAAVLTGNFQGTMRLGFIDREGNEVVSPSYQGNFLFGQYFSEGLSPVTKDGETYSYIDKQGKTVIPPNFSKAKYFQDGLAGASAFSDPEGRWGFIDLSGTFVIEPRYSDVSSFSEGLAAVKVQQNDREAKWGFINKSGDMVIEPIFDSAHDFRQGLAPVKLGKYWGYVNKLGTLVIPAVYTWADNFQDGMAEVSIGESTERYIDLSGRIVWTEEETAPQKSL